MNFNFYNTYFDLNKKINQEYNQYYEDFYASGRNWNENDTKYEDYVRRVTSWLVNRMRLMDDFLVREDHWNDQTGRG